MSKPIFPPQQTLFEQEQLKNERLQHFLITVPYLEFSNKGLQNIAHGFGLSINQLELYIKEFKKDGCNE